MQKKITKLVGLSKEEFDSFVETGQIRLRNARLIPLYKAGDELAQTSIFLSTLRLVKEMRDAVFHETKISKAGTAYFYTEVSIPEIDDKSRMDGLVITVSAGKIKDAAFFEMKNKTDVVDAAQIERYQALAKKIGVTKLVTVSNEFVADSSISPVEYKRLKNFDTYHFSWTYILTIAHLLLIENDNNIEDEDQIEIMKEVVKYLESKETGVSGFHQMKPSWKNVVEKVISGAALKESDPEVNDAVLSWHQEEKDMALMLSRELGVLVNTSSSKKKDHSVILKSSVKSLIKSHTLTSILKVKGSVSDIEIDALFDRRAINMSVSVDAPLDKGFKGRCSWIIKQLEYCGKKEAESFEIIKTELWVEVGFKFTNKTEMFKYSELQNIHELEKDKEITYFRIMASKDIGKGFSSSKKFVEIIEDMLITYYKSIVQNLSNWERPAPKILE